MAETLALLGNLIPCGSMTNDDYVVTWRCEGPYKLYDVKARRIIDENILGQPLLQKKCESLGIDVEHGWRHSFD